MPKNNTEYIFSGALNEDDVDDIEDMDNLMEDAGEEKFLHLKVNSILD